MLPRSFSDDGIDVTIDVHGCSVAAALDIIECTLELAFNAGRSRLLVIHGLGGDDPHSSIRASLRQALSLGEFGDLVTGSFETSGGGRTDLALRYGGPPSPQRLTISLLRRKLP